MDGPRDYQNEWGHTKKIQISYDITYMWNLKEMIQMNLFTKLNRLTDFENKLMVSKQEAWRRRDKSEILD